MSFDWIASKNYKRHYICLDCQKGFKRPSKKDMKHPKNTDLSDLMEKFYSSEEEQDIIAYIKTAHQQLKVVCPNCRNQMIQVHYNFEVPSQRDNKSWNKIKKDMVSKTMIDYTTYISWHKLELKTITKDSAKFENIQLNLSKLVKESNEGVQK